MGIAEITNTYDGTLSIQLSDGIKQQIHRVWQFDILQQVLILERYGSMCGWAELKLKKKDLECYRIEKPWGSQVRTEFFFNKQSRTYAGNQVSFVEYLNYMAEHNEFPKTSVITEMGLDSTVADEYHIQAKKILQQA
jgi:hypothetical protein